MSQIKCSLWGGQWNLSLYDTKRIVYKPQQSKLRIEQARCKINIHSSNVFLLKFNYIQTMKRKEIILMLNMTMKSLSKWI
jgi:hypothetical protein